MGQSIFSSTSALALAALVLVATTVGGQIYRRAWISRRGPDETPTGFGVFLATALLLAAVISGARTHVIAAFLVLHIAGLIYWLDDLVELSARTRLAVSFVTGVALCVLLTWGAATPPWQLALLAVLAGLINVVLTNIVNFYDGADLNLATFIALTALALLLTAPSRSLLWFAGLGALAFIVPFAVMNSRPRTIYLGDGGSFVFACLLTVIAVLYLTTSEVSARVAIPAALPMLDTFYVLCVRIIEKHDLLTRNYLHLYQKLNQHSPGFAYLLPQIVNAGLALVLTLALQWGGLGELAAVAMAATLVTIPFYFFCRRRYVPSERA